MVKNKNVAEFLIDTTYELIHLLIQEKEHFFIKIFGTRMGWTPKIPENLINSDKVKKDGILINIMPNANVQLKDGYIIANVTFDGINYFKKIYPEEIISVHDSEKIIILFNNFPRSSISRNSEIDEIAELISEAENLQKEDIKKSIQEIVKNIKEIDNEKL